MEAGQHMDSCRRKRKGRFQNASGITTFASPAERPNFRFGTAQERISDESMTPADSAFVHG
jgi:hypothetical protein